MKKAWVFLLALALIALSVPVFADAPVVKGNFMWFSNYDFSGGTTASTDVKSRVKIDTNIDKNNEVYIELRGEAFAVSGKKLSLNEADPLVDYTKLTWGNSDFRVKNFKFVSDLTGALGLTLPVDVKLTGGYWDTYFTNWWYADSTGWCFYYGGGIPTVAVTGDDKTGPGMGLNWSNKLVNFGENLNGAFQLDISALEGKVNVHYYTDALFNQMAVGADVAFAGFGLYVAYGDSAVRGYSDGAEQTFGDGTLSVEAKYDLPELAGFKISVYPYFRYGLGDSTYTWGASVAASYKIVSVGLAAQGDDVNAFNHWSAEASVKPSDASKLWVVALGYAGGFAGVDIGGSYAFGPLSLVAGYIVGNADVPATFPLYGDAFEAYTNGLYLGASVSF